MELNIAGQQLAEFDGADVVRSGGDDAAARVKELDLSRNLLSTVVHLTLLESLSRLLLPNNRLAVLPALPRSLTELDVNDNGLETLCGIERCPHLVSVKAAHNRLTSLGRRLPLQLHSLNVAHNDITCVGAVAGAHGLVRLHLHGNALTAGALVPLGAARALRHLTLRGNPAASTAAGGLDAVRTLVPKLSTFDGVAVTQMTALMLQRLQLPPPPPPPGAGPGTRGLVEAGRRAVAASALAVREAKLRGGERELRRMLLVEEGEGASLAVRRRQLRGQSAQLSSVAEGQRATLARLRSATAVLQEEVGGLRRSREAIEEKFRNSRAADMFGSATAAATPVA